MYQIIEKLLAKPVAFHRIFVDIAGSLAGGLFLSQLYYWRDKGSRDDGYFYKTLKEWQEEIPISRRQWTHARKTLEEKGILDCKRFGLDPKLYYKLNTEALYAEMEKLSNNETAPSYDMDNGQSHCMTKESSNDEITPSYQTSNAQNAQRSEQTLGSVSSEHWTSVSNEHCGVYKADVGSIYTENTLQRIPESTCHRWGKNDEKNLEVKNNFPEEEISTRSHEEQTSSDVDHSFKYPRPISRGCSTFVTHSEARGKYKLGWEKFNWFERVFQENRPSMWSDELPPRTNSLLRKFEEIYSSNPNMEEFKLNLACALQQVEKDSYLWDKGFNYILSACYDLGYKYRSQHELCRASNKTKESVKRMSENQKVARQALEEYRQLFGEEANA